MQISEQTKKILWIVLAAILIVSALVWFMLNPAPKHIEDTNGPDDYSLEVITPEDVAKQKMGTRGTLNESETHLEVAGFDVSSGLRYSSRKFTGVYLLYSATVFKGSDIYVYLADFQVNGGNFAFYILLDGEIVGEVKPDESGISEFRLDNIEKTASVEYVIAAESANFKFTVPSEW